jgi:phosphoglycolate phosphatase-like HAD superfamily hydrolase
MAAQSADTIYVFDLHNTLYDEVVEFGSSIAVALAVVLDAAKAQGVDCDLASLSAELATAHAAVGSDWDPDVWETLPTVRKLSDPKAVAEAAIEARQSKSELQTRLTAYGSTIEAIKMLRAQGVSLYLATEATANAAADAVRWLSLDGLFEAVYSWPYNKPFTELEQSQQRDFPENEEDAATQKPHAFILAQIVLDHAKQIGKIGRDTALEDVFATETDETIDVSVLDQDLPEGTDAAVFAQAISAIKSRLVVLDGPHSGVLKQLLGSLVYVGDSFFKDGILAYNAGVSFVHAAYGKVVAEEDAQFVEECKETLYSVTGWEPLLLQCTHEASKVPELSARVCPVFVCDESFAEFLKYSEEEHG